MTFFEWSKAQPYRRDASVDYGQVVWNAAYAEGKRAMREQSISIVRAHQLHVELSPGVGLDKQSYGIAVCQDILLALEVRDG